jgi:hypothetical protein
MDLFLTITTTCSGEACLYIQPVLPKLRNMFHRVCISILLEICFHFSRIQLIVRAYRTVNNLHLK